MRSFYPASIVLLIFILGLIFSTSCGKDETNKDRPLRIKSLTTVYEYTMPSYTITSTIKYYYNSKNQQVAISTKDGQDSISISYGGDGRISGMVIFISGSEKLNFHAEWNGKQLTMYYNPEKDAKLIYYFNDNDFVEKVEGIYFENNEWITFRYDEYQWENGNPVYFESYLLSSKASNRIGFFNEPNNSFLSDLTNFSLNICADSLKGATLKKEFTSRLLFDGYKSPYCDSPVYRILIFEAWGLFSSNNPVQIITELYNSSGAVYKTDTNSYIYEYNSLSLPVKRTTHSELNQTRTTSYLYE